MSEDLEEIKADVTTCKDLFKVDYEAYEDSIIESLEVQEMYHNRQYTMSQLAKLANRGQPAETFNVIKLFVRMLLGYYSTVVNTATAKPVHYEDIPRATLINDLLDYTFRVNNFVTEGDSIKLDAFLSGLFACERKVINTGRKDRFGRPIRRIMLQAVNCNEIVPDASSRAQDFSDSRRQHRYKWIAKDDLIRLYGKDKVEECDAYFNHLNIDQAEFDFNYNGMFNGHFRIYDNYLIVETTLLASDGKIYCIHWCGDVELYKKDVTKSAVPFKYLIGRLQTSHRTEFYGIFREVKESQKAINQAILKIQLMANTQKVLVEEGAVDDIDDFTDAYNRVNSVIQVNDLAGIRVENMSREVQDQYIIIDKAFDRIQRILGINDSFLGLAFASDSGRKVKLQQNATIISLHYLTNRIQQYYKMLGEDVVEMIKENFIAEETIRIDDEVNGERWVTINAPMEIPTGQVDPQTGQPKVEYRYEYVMDGDKPKVDSNGQYVVQPIPDESTEIKGTDVEIVVVATAYNDEDEKNQLMLETILSGNVGGLLSQVNPAGFFKAAALSMKSYKTKHSPDIARLFEQTAAMLANDPEAAQRASLMAMGNKKESGGSLSQSLKLPQNTNEGVE